MSKFHFYGWSSFADYPVFSRLQNCQHYIEHSKINLRSCTLMFDRIYVVGFCTLSKFSLLSSTMDLVLKDVDGEIRFQSRVSVLTLTLTLFQRLLCCCNTFDTPLFSAEPLWNERARISPKVNNKYCLSAHSFYVIFVMNNQPYLLHSLVLTRLD